MLDSYKEFRKSNIFVIALIIVSVSFVHKLAVSIYMAMVLKMSENALLYITWGSFCLRFALFLVVARFE
jgi:hypothetical protein